MKKIFHSPDPKNKLEKATDDWQKQMGNALSSYFRRWKYAGQNWMAGHDLTKPEGKVWYEKNKKIILAAGGLKTFTRDNKKHPLVFVQFEKNTPDEDAYVHDLDYAHAECCKKKEDENYKKFVADIKFLENVRNFIKGKRRSIYDKMDDKTKNDTLGCYSAMATKIGNDLAELKRGPHGAKVNNIMKKINLKKMQEEWTKEQFHIGDKKPPVNKRKTKGGKSCNGWNHHSGCVCGFGPRRSNK